MADRPGVMIYFDQWEPLLESDNETVAAIFRAVIMYAKYGEVPDFSGVHAILWGMIRPTLDRDAVRYEQTREARRYATYCRESKKTGKEPLSFEEWEQMVSFDTMRYQSDPTTTTVSSPTTNPSPNPNTTQKHLQQERQLEKETQGDAGGGEGKTAIFYRNGRYVKIVDGNEIPATKQEIEEYTEAVKQLQRQALLNHG